MNGNCIFDHYAYISINFYGMLNIVISRPILLWNLDVNKRVVISHNYQYCSFVKRYCYKPKCCIARMACFSLFCPKMKPCLNLWRLRQGNIIGVSRLGAHCGSSIFWKLVWHQSQSNTLYSPFTNTYSWNIHWIFGKANYHFYLSSYNMRLWYKYNMYLSLKTPD